MNVTGRQIGQKKFWSLSFVIPPSQMAAAQWRLPAGTVPD
jgi:hypothetical protein